MIKTIFKTIGVTLLVLYLLLAGVLYSYWRDEPRYRAVKVVVQYPNDEAQFVTEAGILQLVNSKPGFKVKGQRYSEVDTYDLARYLSEHNRLIRHVSCYHTPDSLLRIDVEQRNPVMRIKSMMHVPDGKGNSWQDFYLDDAGEMMPAQFGTAIQLPLVTGYVGPGHLQPLADFVRYIKSDDFWSAQITQIHLALNGDVSLVPRVGSHTILLGSFDNYRTKLQHVRTFYDDVLPRRGWNAYRVINVKFDGQVVGEKYSR